MSIPAENRDTSKRRVRLLEVWRETTADRERIASYIEHRGLPRELLDSIPLDVLRFHSALPYFDDEGEHRGEFPALVAKVTDVDAKGVTLHRTYLSPDGPGKLDLGDGLPAKKLMTAVADGATRGGSIKLCPPGSTLGLTEGIETALAVMAATGQRVWAAGNAGSLEAVKLPSEVTRVHIWADRDNSRQGEAAAERAAIHLHEEGRVVFLHVPPGKEKQDWLDVYVRHGEDSLLAALTESPPWTAQSAGSSGMVVLSTVVPEEVEWLWEGRIPLGKLTVVDGDPGTGKSTMTLDLAARASRGEAMPEESGKRSPVGVVILSAEDGLADTIVPRLVAAGADLSRIIAVTECPDREGEGTHPPVLPDNLDTIRQAIVKIDAKLLIIDPLMAYLSDKTNSHRDQDIRRVLFQIAALAEEMGVAVVVVRHLNKSNAGPAIYRGGGSIGIIGAARSGLLVALDPDDEDRRVLASTKLNLGRRPESLVFRLEAREGKVAGIVWEGTSPHLANELLSDSQTAEAKTACDEAKDLLVFLLAEGPVASTQITTEARAAGISVGTLRRAKRALGVECSKTGMRSGWTWSLPKVATDSRRWPTPEDEHLRTSSQNDGHLRQQEEPLLEAFL